ncbi:MAG: family oxidoreductase [Alphaproteobacteria bacterium]|nr:family oxidoreductase [Alphaproteobacteria bacterium]
MNDEKAKTVLVAGGAGFIGSHLVEALLAEGATVVCLDSYLTGLARNLRHLERESRFDLVEGDVIDALPARVGRVPFTHIYNLACAASPPRYQADPEHTLLTNVLGTRNLLRLAEEKEARFLLASTSEVYGDPEMHPQPETYRGRVSCTGPRACYDEGKRAAEALVFDYQRMGRADIRVARLFNTYGPRMRPDDGRVVSNVVRQALAGDDITIYGDGSQTRSFCYVDDMVAGLMRLMDSDVADGPVNLGNPGELTVVDLIDRVLRLTGSRSRIVYRPLPTDDPHRRRPDIGRARALLGWEPKIELEQGLEATAAWFAEEQRRAPRPSPPAKPAVPSSDVVAVAAE